MTVRAFAVGLSLLMTASVMAEQKVAFGIETDGSTYHFKDIGDEGDASSFSQVQILNAITLVEFDRETRVRGSLDYRSFKIDPTAEVVGQDGKMLSLSASYQTRFDFSRNAYLWAGFGAGGAQYEYTNRVLVDDEGYRLKSFKNERGTSFFGLANIGREFEMSSSWLVGLAGEFEYHLSGQMTVTTLSLSVLYK